MSDRSRRPRLSFVPLVASLAAACTVDRDDLAGSGHVEYWRPNAAGHVSITKASRAGTATTTSLRRDLGIDHADAPIGGLDVDLGRHRFALEYIDLSLHGSNIATESFLFHGQTYAQGDRVTADLEAPTTRLDWTYAFWRDGRSAWRAGVGARMWTFDMKIADRTASLHERRHFSHVYPLIASDAFFELSKGFFARIGGDLAATSRRREMVEGAAALGYGAGRWSSELGWRFLRFDFNESTNDADFNMNGPFVALRVAL